jgi:CxxC motif-containing protein (DUF1111 family)
MRISRSRLAGEAAILGLAFVLLAGHFLTKSGKDKNPEPKISGRELFTREWLPGDLRSHAGDGLGPVFNARSCVACHHQGAVGGAGPRHMNVTVVSAILESPPQQPPPDRSKLAQIHPTLRTENSFSLHRFGTEKEFAQWKRELHFDTGPLPEEPDANGLRLEEAGADRPSLRDNDNALLARRHVGSSEIPLISSQRNTPPLFGAGLIDRIPDRVLEEVAASQAQAVKSGAPAEPGFVVLGGHLVLADSPLPISGRVARLRDGRVGRFGWKAQTASLREFTLQACANELGLEVPGFSQATLPWDPGYKAPGLDLNAEECAALVHFVASLPPPARKPPETEQHAAEIAAGQRLFARTGCAVCHRPKLGDVEGIYSDLLLHDMGQQLADTGQYGLSIVPGDGPSDGVEPLPIIGSEPDGPDKKRPKFGAGPREWRTPPLWGLRDSAPYLHDGRAETISAAVALHGGEGDESAQQFFRLGLRERQQVELFLQSLGLPR